MEAAYWPGLTIATSAKVASTWIFRWRYGSHFAASPQAELRMRMLTKKVESEPQGQYRVLLVRDPYERALSCWRDGKTRTRHTSVSDWFDWLHATKGGSATWDWHYRPQVYQMRASAWDMVLDIDCPMDANIAALVDRFDLPNPPPRANVSRRDRQPLVANVRLANMAREIWAEDYKWLSSHRIANRSYGKIV